MTFDGVTKTYPDGTTAVNGLDLDIKDGEFMVLVGPSGCGKTTALRMVAGLEDISRGVLKIGDRIVNHVPSRDRDNQSRRGIRVLASFQSEAYLWQNQLAANPLPSGAVVNSEVVSRR